MEREREGEGKGERERERERGRERERVREREGEGKEGREGERAPPPPRRSNLIGFCVNLAKGPQTTPSDFAQAIGHPKDRKVKNMSRPSIS